MNFEHIVEAKNHLFAIRAHEAGSMEAIHDSLKRAYQAVLDGTILRDYGILIFLDKIDHASDVRQADEIEQYIVHLQSCVSGAIAIVATRVGTVLPAHIIATNTACTGHQVMAFTDATDARDWLRQQRDARAYKPGKHAHAF